MLCLVAGCATALPDTGPEVIRYCAESAGHSTPLGAASNCIPRP